MSRLFRDDAQERCRLQDQGGVMRLLIKCPFRTNQKKKIKKVQRYQNLVQHMHDNHRIAHFTERLEDLRLEVRVGQNGLEDECKVVVCACGGEKEKFNPAPIISKSPFILLNRYSGSLEDWGMPRISICMYTDVLVPNWSKRKAVSRKLFQ